MPLLASASTPSVSTMADGVKNVMSVVSTVMTTITGNEILLTFFVSSLVGVAIGIAKSLRAHS